MFAGIPPMPPLEEPVVLVVGPDAPVHAWIELDGRRRDLGGRDRVPARDLRRRVEGARKVSRAPGGRASSPLAS